MTSPRDNHEMIDAAPIGAEEGAEPTGPLPTPRLQEKYSKQVLPTLAEKFGRKNALATTRLWFALFAFGLGLRA